MQADEERNHKVGEDQVEYHSPEADVADVEEPDQSDQTCQEYMRAKSVELNNRERTLLMDWWPPKTGELVERYSQYLAELQ